MATINNPRIVWLSDLFRNPSFEGEGATALQPLSWIKNTDGDASSTFTKETGARETELGTFRSELEVLATDTFIQAEQEVNVALADLKVGDVLLFGVWLNAPTAAISGNIQIILEDSVDADLESSTQAFSLTSPFPTGFIFTKVEHTIVSLTNYDHIRIIIRDDSTGAKLYADDCIFGKILDFPKVTNTLGNTNIQNIQQQQGDIINSRSSSNVLESLRPNQPWFTFDISITSFRQVFYDSLFEFWKYARNGGNKWFAFFLDKDSFDLADFHYPYLVLINPEWSPELRVGLVRYDIILECAQVLPFELS